MNQYISKSDLVSEIEKRIKETESMQPKFDQFWAGQISAFKGVLKILDTIETKEVDNIWHIASETDLPKVGDVVCLIKDGRIISGEYRANKFYGKVCDGYDNSLEKGDKWCYLYGDLLKAELKKENKL